MRKHLLLAFAISFQIAALAQQKAITEIGDEVVLYDDGTWEYVNPEDVEIKEIPLNEGTFKKPAASSFQLKSGKLNVGFWLNPKKWSFSKNVDNDAAEYELQLKGEDLYGMIITEKVEIPLETLKEIALENARDIAPDSKVVKEEYRMVNDIKVLHLQFNGTAQGIKFAYYGYYYSNGNGTVQFVTYTAQSLLNEYLKDAEELLNGLIEL